MRTATGAMVGLLFALGLCVAAAGAIGVPGRVRRVSLPPEVWMRSVGVVVAFVTMWLVTGWPASGVISGAAVAIAPVLVEVQRHRTAANERSEALAAWAEMLRDTISAHAGLREAIAVTARVAPASIRPYVQALAIRAEREPLGDALRRFAAEVKDPVADLIVAALVIAAERQAQRLSEMLSHIAAASREHASMRLRVETGRARTYASARALVLITFALGAMLLVLSPQFMKPYSSATGQLVLVVIGALFAGALGALVQMGRPALSPRLFTGTNDTEARTP